MFASHSAVPGCNCIDGAVSEAPVEMGWVGRWVGVGVRVLMLWWVTVVDGGFGERRLGSGNSVGGEPRGRVIVRMMSVWVVPLVVVGVRACIVLPVPR